MRRSVLLLGLVVLAAAATLGLASSVLASSCAMGDACPLRQGGTMPCHGPTGDTLELGCCTGSALPVPAAAAPDLAPSGLEPAPETSPDIAPTAPRLDRSASRQDRGRRLRVGLFTLHAAFLI